MPVLTVSDSNLSFNAGTITGTGEINGYSPFTSDLGGDVLINAQTNAAQNGLYTLSGYNTTSGAWTLTRVTAIASLPTTDFYSVLQGNLANANFGLVAGAAQFNQIVDVFNPVTTSVVALSNSNLNYDSTTNTISGTGAINGYTPTVNDIGNDVLVNDQTDPTQNGLYSFTAYDSTTNTWTLTQDTAVSAMTPKRVSWWRMGRVVAVIRPINTSAWPPTARRISCRWRRYRSTHWPPAWRIRPPFRLLPPRPPRSLHSAAPARWSSMATPSRPPIQVVWCW